jgi:hypothetical protein
MTFCHTRAKIKNNQHPFKTKNSFKQKSRVCYNKKKYPRVLFISFFTFGFAIIVPYT